MEAGAIDIQLNIHKQETSNESAELIVNIRQHDRGTAIDGPFDSSGTVIF